MPITNDIKITPMFNIPRGDEISPVIGEGIYDAEIIDITYIPPERNKISGKPQLRFKFKIVSGEYSGVTLFSWVSMSLNPGWENGNPSHLYTIAKSVMGKEPDLNSDFYPNVLMGGKLKIWIEVKTSPKTGNQYSKIVKYSPIVQTKASNTTVAEKHVKSVSNITEDKDGVPFPTEPYGKEEEFDDEDIPF
jgi:hypothetical protein